MKLGDYNKSENFEGLAHHVMRQKLVEKKGYPASIMKLKFEYNRAIRGLVIDLSLIHISEPTRPY